MHQYHEVLRRGLAAPIQHQVAIGVRNDPGGGFLVSSKEGQEIIANAFAGQLKEEGCKDFLCFDTENRFLGKRMTITVQVAEGITPARAYQEVAEQRDIAEKHLGLVTAGYRGVANTLQANHLALRELVTLKQIKDDDNIPEMSDPRVLDYQERKPLAWARAKQLVDAYAPKEAIAYISDVKNGDLLLGVADGMFAESFGDQIAKAEQEIQDACHVPAELIGKVE
jgi:hypothetical protein